MSSFVICLTHDVDRVRKTYQYITHDLLNLRLKNILSKKRRTNPYWCFERIMELEERYRVRSTFFFLHETIPVKLLKLRSYVHSMGRYSLNEPEIIKAIKQLDQGGWEIGLHGSYDSYLNGDLLSKEKAILERVLERKVVGIRQHYLNLKIPTTWKLQRSAGFEYDASYGKKRGIGYLNDKEKPFWDDSSGMFIIPLIFMECNLVSKAKKMKKNALKLALELMDRAEEKNAVFTILWHQRLFNEHEFPHYTTLYSRIIEEGISRKAEFLTCGELYKRYSENQK